MLVNLVSQEIELSDTELTFVPIHHNAMVSQPLEINSEMILMFILIPATNEKTVQVGIKNGSPQMTVSMKR